MRCVKTTELQDAVNRVQTRCIVEAMIRIVHFLVIFWDGFFFFLVRIACPPGTPLMKTCKFNKIPHFIQTPLVIAPVSSMHLLCTMILSMHNCSTCASGANQEDTWITQCRLPQDTVSSWGGGPSGSAIFQMNERCLDGQCRCACLNRIAFKADR